MGAAPGVFAVINLAEESKMVSELIDQAYYLPYVGLDTPMRNAVHGGYC